ncbi:MAG: hypothetical protein M0R17_05575 [Candidatus Omnitrophica bacterium]|jgi:hypothetical protein|nr:hypothetical protein [Candidatus Omnitrophota bacterium]
MGVVTINDSKYEKQYNKKIEFYLDDKLKRRTDEKIKLALSQEDKDFLAIVDGKVGSGKSTFAIQWAKYVDQSFCLERICFTPEEFRNAILKAKKGQAVIYDEAFTGLSSRTALTQVNGCLVSLAMQVRQKNLFIILVLPLVFLLDKYFVMDRAKCLVHVSENKNGNRGYFRIYNENKIKQLILLGKNTFSYSKSVWTKFRGRFYGKFGLGEELKKSYLEKKEKALNESGKNPISSGQIKYMEQRNLLIWLLRKEKGLTYHEIENLLLDYQVEISYVQIRNICAKFGDVEGVSKKRIEEKIEKRDKIKKKDNNLNESLEKDEKVNELVDITKENKEKEQEIDLDYDIPIINGAEQQGMSSFAVKSEDYLDESALNEEESNEND